MDNKAGIYWLVRDAGDGYSNTLSLDRDEYETEAEACAAARENAAFHKHVVAVVKLVAVFDVPIGLKEAAAKFRGDLGKGSLEYPGKAKAGWQSPGH